MTRTIPMEMVENGEVFGGYRESPHNQFLHLAL
jgi:hypothetical protein